MTIQSAKELDCIERYTNNFVINMSHSYTENNWHSRYYWIIPIAVFLGWMVGKITHNSSQFMKKYGKKPSSFLISNFLILYMGPDKEIGQDFSKGASVSNWQYKRQYRFYFWMLIAWFFSANQCHVSKSTSQASSNLNRSVIWALLFSNQVKLLRIKIL